MRDDKLLPKTYRKAYELFLDRWNADNEERKRRKRVADANRRFRNATLEQKRVIIAKDVLAQIKAKRILPKQMDWAQWTVDKNTYNDLRGRVLNDNADVELNEVLGNATCNACAVGAMFVCAVNRADQLKLNETDPEFDDDSCFGLGEYKISMRQEDTFDYLGRFFDEDQLQLIEIAFERGAGGCYADPADVDAQRAKQFCAQSWAPEERMVAIMENVIANKGTFVP